MKTAYTFTFQQLGPGGWYPNYQYIEAKSPGRALATLGLLIDAQDAIIRDIRYGTYIEMEDTQELEQAEAHIEEEEGVAQGVIPMRRGGLLRRYRESVKRDDDTRIAK